MDRDRISTLRHFFVRESYSFRNIARQNEHIECEIHPTSGQCMKRKKRERVRVLEPALSDIASSVRLPDARCALTNIEFSDPTRPTAPQHPLGMRCGS
jgi:hypothetical protein